MEIKVEAKPQIGENYPQDIELKSTVMDSSGEKKTHITAIENESQNILKENGELKSKTFSSSSHLNSDTKSDRNCVSSNKTLSFGIERMLNFNPSKNSTSEKNNCKPKVNLSTYVPLQRESTAQKTKDSPNDVREEYCESDADEKEDDDVENISTTEGFAAYEHSRRNSFTNNFSSNPNAVVPLGLSLNSRPMWPSLFSYIGNQWPECNRDRFGVIRRVGHPYQNRSPPKRKKPRTAFTRQQVMELEKRFSRQKYLASAERSTLAKGLNMSDSQVKTWFQNRRTKWRRQTAEEREMERQAAQKFLLSIQREEGQSLYSPLCSPPTSGHYPSGLTHGIDVRYIDSA